MRFITAANTPAERVTHLTGWRDRDGLDVVNLVCGRDFTGQGVPGGNLANAKLNGAQQTFVTDADGRGYTQEIAVPWRLLTSNGQPLRAGESFRLNVHPN